MMHAIQAKQRFAGKDGYSEQIKWQRAHSREWLPGCVGVFVVCASLSVITFGNGIAQIIGCVVLFGGIIALGAFWISRTHRLDQLRAQQLQEHRRETAAHHNASEEVT